MSLLPEYQSLERTVGFIQRHPNYPGKQWVLEECLEDIDERYRLGRITAEQHSRLKSILLQPTAN